MVPARVAARAAAGPARPRRGARRPPREARARAARPGARAGRERGPLRLRRVALRDGPRPPRGRGARRRRGGPPSRQLRRRRQPAAHEGRPAVRRLQPVLARLEDPAAARGPRCAAQPERAVGPARRGDPARRVPAAGSVRAGREGGPRSHARLRARRARAVRRAPRPHGRRNLRALAVPALRLRQRARARGEGRRERRVRAPALLARLLRARAAPPPGQRQARVPARDGRSGMGGRRPGVRRLVRGPHGLPGRRRGDAAAAHARLDAQPRAADRRLVPHEGPARRLAARRGALHAVAAVRRRGAEQRQLAVDRFGRCRSRALLPAHVQPGDAAEAPRPGRRVRPPLAAGAARRAAREARRAVDDDRRRAGGRRLRHRPRLPAADRRPQGRARARRWSATAPFVPPRDIVPPPMAESYLQRDQPEGCRRWR